MFNKKLLTTTTTLALITSAANSSLAGERTTQSNPSAFNNTGHWDPSGVIQTQDYITMGNRHRINVNLDDIYIEDIAGDEILRDLVALHSDLTVGNITAQTGTEGLDSFITIKMVIM